MSRMVDTEWLNNLVQDAPESWDDDESIENIVSRWVNHLVAEVKRLGGCLHPWCRHENDELCDHGYLPTELARDAASLLQLEKDLAAGGPARGALGGKP